MPLIKVQPAMHGAAIHTGEVRRRVERASFGQIRDNLQPTKEFHVLGLREDSSQTTPVMRSEGKILLLLRLGHANIVAGWGTIAKFMATHLASIPGISAVALSLYSPLSGNNRGTDVWVDGHPAPGSKDENHALWNRVTAGYFKVLGNPILQGRDISELDTTASRNVAVVNEAFARKFFKNEDPLGKQFGRADTGDSRQYEIVGIAKNARYLTLHYDKPIGPAYFLPEAQHDVDSKGKITDSDVNSHFLRDIVIVTKPGASLSLTRVRQAMTSIDPNLPVISIRTLIEQVALQFTPQRLMTRLTSFFGVLSLLLACIGLYGVTTYNAERRTNEIGVRMALGAHRRQVVALILRGAFGLIVLGLFLGFPLTLGAGRLLGHQLYGLSPYHPAVMFGAVITLGVSALVASLIPALRASLISPLEALRAE